MYRTKAIPKNRSPDKVFWRPAERVLGMVVREGPSNEEKIPDGIPSDIQYRDITSEDYSSLLQLEDVQRVKGLPSYAINLIPSITITQQNVSQYVIIIRLSLMIFRHLINVQFVCNCLI